MRKVKYKVDFSNREIIVKSAMQNDSLTLEIEVLDNGEQVSLADSNIELLWVKPDNFPKKISENITIQNNRIIVNDVDVECTSVSGICNFELTIKKSDKQISTFPLTLKVIQSVINNPSVENTVMKLLEDLIIASNNGENVLLAMDKWAEEHQDLENIADVLSSVKASVKELSSQIAEIEKQEVRTETLNNAVEIYVNTAIDDGRMANLTIEDNSIESKKYKNKSITREKINDEVGELIDIESVDESYLYAIIDSEKRIAFGIKKDGAVEILTKLITDSLNLNSANIKIINSLNTLNNQQIIEDTLDNYLMAGTVDITGKVAENAIGKDGRVPDWILQAWANRFPITEEFREKILNGINKTIICWGDSLTAGAGGGGTTYPKVLAELSGLTVYNGGVGGENTKTVACRQGARRIMINNITIPASSTEKVQIGSYGKLYDDLGNVVYPLRQGDGGIGTCILAGVEGKFSCTQTSSTSTDIIYFFKRNADGEKVIINRPTPLIGTWSIERKNDIQVIFIGQNGGYTNIDDLVRQQRLMIEHSNNDKYIILGLTSGSATERAELEQRMIREYGRRYINLREYISTYGMEDAELEPTETDLAEMAEGKVPTSLRFDTVHGNHYFYEIIGKLTYSRLIELGDVEEAK